jgi:hypothetical protein
MSLREKKRKFFESVFLTFSLFCQFVLFVEIDFVMLFGKRNSKKWKKGKAMNI